MPVIELQLDSSGAVTGIKNYEKAVKRAERNTESSFVKMRSSVNKLGLAATVGFAATIIPLVKSALSAASSMNETQGIFDKAFAGMMDQANAWSKDLRDNYHLSEQASKEYLGNLQLVITGMGKTKDEAGKMSAALVKTGAELAAAFDKKTVDVVRDIRSAMSGSMEVLDKYGIVVRGTQVSQKALEMGLAATTKELTQADKATAMYNLILERSATVTGTVKDEFNGWAGQIAENEKLIDDLRTAIGQRLMPVFLPLLQNFNEWLAVEGRVEQASKLLVNTIDFLADGFRGVTIVAKGLIVGVGMLAKAFTLVLTPLNLVMKGLEKLGAIDSNPLEGFTKGVDDFVASALENLNKELDNAVIKSGSFAREFEKTKESVDKAKDSVKKAGNDIAELGDKAKEASDKVKVLGTEYVMVNGQLSQFTLTAGKAAKAVEDIGKKGVPAAKNTEVAEKNLRVAVDQVTQSANKSVTALNQQAASAEKVANAVAKISRTKEGSYKASGAWSGGKGKGSSGTGYFSSNAEKQQYNRLTPAGRGSDYFDRYGKYGKRGIGANAYLDVIDRQRGNALNVMGKTQGTTNIFNFNQQVSRSDVTNISAELYRNEARA